MKDKKIAVYEELLQCIYCKSQLKYVRSNFVCQKCARKYPYKDGIAICLGDESAHMLKQAQIYDDEYAKKSYGTKLEYWQQAYIKRTAQMFDLDKPQATPKRYLDVGAGPGHTVIRLAQNNLTAIGCDISLTGAQQAMKMARRAGVFDRVYYVVCDARNLPFKKQSIDYISCIMLLEHLEHDDEVIGDMARILKKGGSVYVAVPNTYWHFWFFMWPINYWHDRRLGHLRHYSANTLRRLMNQQKLNTVSVFYSAHLIKFVQLFYQKAPKKYQKKLWWFLESLDEAQHKVPTGLHLNGVFRKK